MKNVSQDTQSLGRDSNQGSPEYKTGVSANRPQRSVCYTHFRVLQLPILYLKVYKLLAQMEQFLTQQF